MKGAAATEGTATAKAGRQHLTSGDEQSQSERLPGGKSHSGDTNDGVSPDTCH